MSERFLKFILSNETDYLQENHPNAFLLLCTIAKRARRTSNHADGLEIGTAYLGDYKKSGIETERKYRTAKKILEMRGHIKIIETCRNRKKSTTGMTTVGTMVKILRSDVWDVNLIVDDDRDDDRVTTNKNELEASSCIFFDRSSQKFVGVSEEQKQVWQQAYPHLNIEQQLAKMADWLPTHKAVGNKKFIENWLKTEKTTKKIENIEDLIIPEIDETILKLTASRTYDY